MSDLKSLIEDITKQISTVSYSFVYYEKDTGKIQKISNKEIKSDFEVIKIETDLVKDIIHGKKRIDDFKVSYDLSEKRFTVKEITYESELSSIKNKLHEINTIYSTNSFDSKSLKKFKTHFEKIYEGVDVFIWINNFDYEKNSIVWFDNNVYKIIEDMPAGKSFDFNKAELYIEDVFLLDTKSEIDTLNIFDYERIYEGIFVDVWYDELEHLSGQHVWKNNSVYKIINDQKSNTEFDIKNAELIVENVKLYDDENKTLSFNKNLNYKDKFLQNNQLFMCTNIKDAHVKKTACSFSATNSVKFVCEDNVVSLLKYKDNDTELEPIQNLTSKINLKSPDQLSFGEKCIIKSNLYIKSKIDYEYDVKIVQDNYYKCWTIKLDKKTINTLKNTYLGNDTLYFSITSKNDPNILYRIFKCSIKELLDNTISFSFEYSWEFENEEVSVYTPKYFKKYIHEVREW